MIINWISKHGNWAFGNLCRHLIKKMPSHKHITDGKNGNIQFICSPSFLRTTNDRDNVILHVDSNRWYEPFIKESE